MVPKLGRTFKGEKVFSNNTCALVDINKVLKITSINGKYLKHYEPTMFQVKIQQKSYSSKIQKPPKAQNSAINSKRTCKITTLKGSSKKVSKSS